LAAKKAVKTRPIDFGAPRPPAISLASHYLRATQSRTGRAFDCCPLKKTNPVVAFCFSFFHQIAGRGADQLFIAADNWCPLENCFEQRRRIV